MTQRENYPSKFPNCTYFDRGDSLVNFSQYSEKNRISYSNTILIKLKTGTKKKNLLQQKKY